MVTTSNKITEDPIPSPQNDTTSYEARRVPEVTDDGDSSSEVDKQLSSVDSWKPTIKDRKVNEWAHIKERREHSKGSNLGLSLEETSCRK